MADQPVLSVPVAPAGLSRRAQRFIETEGIRVRRQDIRCHRDAWIKHGIPAAEIERAAAFQDRWGGLALPPAPFYEGGPRILDADWGRCRNASGTGHRSAELPSPDRGPAPERASAPAWAPPGRRGAGSRGWGGYTTTAAGWCTACSAGSRPDHRCRRGSAACPVTAAWSRALRAPCCGRTRAVLLRRAAPGSPRGGGASSSGAASPAPGAGQTVGALRVAGAGTLRAGPADPAARAGNEHERFLQRVGGQRCAPPTSCWCRRGATCGRAACPVLARPWGAGRARTRQGVRPEGGAEVGAGGRCRDRGRRPPGSGRGSWRAGGARG